MLRFVTLQPAAKTVFVFRRTARFVLCPWRNAEIFPLLGNTTKGHMEQRVRTASKTELAKDYDTSGHQTCMPYLASTHR